MKLLNKIKNIFKKDESWFFQKKRSLTNSDEIQRFFDKDSGWEKKKLVYFYDPKQNLITSYASFSRPPTENEIKKIADKKISTKSYEVKVESFWSKELEDRIKEM